MSLSMHTTNELVDLILANGEKKLPKLPAIYSMKGKWVKSYKCSGCSN